MSLKVTPVDWNSVQDKAQNKVDRKNPVHARQTLSIIKYHQVSSTYSSWIQKGLRVVRGVASNLRAKALYGSAGTRWDERFDIFFHHWQVCWVFLIDLSMGMATLFQQFHSQGSAPILGITWYHESLVSGVGKTANFCGLGWRWMKGFGRLWHPLNQPQWKCHGRWSHKKNIRNILELDTPPLHCCIFFRDPSVLSRHFYTPKWLLEKEYVIQSNPLEAGSCFPQDHGWSSDLRRLILLNGSKIHKSSDVPIARQCLPAWSKRDRLQLMKYIEVLLRNFDFWMTEETPPAPKVPKVW